MKHITLILTLFISILSSANAKQDSIWLSGMVKDSFTRSDIYGAVIHFATPQGLEVAVDTMRPKRIYSEGGLWFYNDPGYQTWIPFAGRYIVTIEADGYSSEPQEFVIPLKQYHHKVTSWKQDFLIKKAPIETELAGASVKASRIKMVIKGDTVIYNADAFQLSEGSMLDNLIRALPGMELKAGGIIEHNGKKVDELLVNGKDFFAGDPKIALENLPAYTVNKVKVYRKEDKASFLMRDSDEVELNKKLVVDVNLKKEYNTGWTANAEAGGGTADKFMLRAFLMRFTDRTKLFAWGQANNIDNFEEANANGNWNSSYRYTGTTNARLGGLTFRVDRKDEKLTYTGNVKAKYNNWHSDSFVSSTQFLQGGDTYGRNHNLSVLRSTEIETKHALESKLDNALLRSDILELNYSSSKNNALDRDLTFDADPKESYRGAAIDSLFSPIGSKRLHQMLITQSENHYFDSNRQLSLYHYTNFSFLEPAFGNRIVITLQGHYINTHKHANSLYSYNQIRQESATIQPRYQNTPTMMYDYSSRLEYKLHTFKNTNIDLGYVYYQWLNSKNQELFLLDSIGAVSATGQEILTLPSVREALLQSMDLQNSYNSINFYRNHNASLRTDTKMWKHGHLNANLGFYVNNKSLRDHRSLSNQRIDRSFTSLEPELSYTHMDYNKDGSLLITLRYNLRTSDPKMRDMLDMDDTSNPLIVRKGNQNLKQEHTHRLSYTHDQNKTRHNQNIRFSLGWSLTENATAQSYIFDRQTGITTYQPRNIDGNWESYGNFGFSRKVDKKEYWKLSTETRINFNNNVDYVSDTGQPERSSVQNLNFEQKVTCTFNYKKTNLILGTEAKWTNTSSHRDNFNAIHAWDLGCYAWISQKLPAGIDLTSDFSLSKRTGYSDRNMNDIHYVWNLTISRAFLKSKALVVKLRCVDLLNSLDNTYNRVNAQGRTETWYNVQPRYVMIHALYRLNGFKARKH